MLVVRGLELGELIAEGAFGSVYRATQPSVGREVAVKVVRPDLADDPEFIRRFEAEAQIVARLEHPHIVPLHDFWREPGGAYLVMRYLRGGTAEQVLARGEMTVELVGRIVEQVGGALAAAHDAGVLHRDVKPSNILLDERGDTYLTDFGIAIDIQTADGDGGPSAGSPLYVSPEQVTGGDLSARSDVYSLGVVVFELLAGRPLFVADTIDDLLQLKVAGTRPQLAEFRTDLPAAVGEVIAQATATDPGDRLESVADFSVAFLNAMGPATGGAVSPRTGGVPAGARSTVISAEVEIVNPYKGLRAFSEADVSEFHGREILTGQLVQAVEGSRFVIVVGASGSGKSSVVRAGLISQLRRGAIEGSDEWFVTAVTPGVRPFEQLEAGLLKIAVNPPERLLAQLEDGERGLARTILRVLPDDDSELLLVIDQFEELFTLTDEDTRNLFLDALASVVEDESSRTRVVCTVRADFYDGPLSHPAIGDLVKEHSVPVSPMNRVELADAIATPAQRVGVTLEPGLTARLVADVTGSPGSLPMLQYTLTELFDDRDASVMTEAAYDALGGISGAIAARAEDLYTQLDGAQEEAARRLFGRLVSLGEGTEDTRRRVSQDDLSDDPPTRAVIDAYGKARLLAFDRNPQTRVGTVEVAHEALIREWPRLRVWVDEDRDQLRALNHLTTAAQAWDQRGRETADLYRGARLDTANQFTTTHTDISALETEFIDASTTDAETEQLRQRRTNRRLRNLLIAAAVLLIVAVGAGVLALDNSRNADSSARAAVLSAADAGEQRTLAEDRARETELDRLVAASSEVAVENRSLAVLLALEANRLRPDSASAQAVFESVAGTPAPLRLLEVGEFDAIDVSADGSAVGVASFGLVRVFDAATGAEIGEPAEFEATRPILAVTGGGRRWVAADTSSGRFVVRDTISGQVLREAEVGGVISALLISPDGEFVATVSSSDALGAVTAVRAGALALWEVSSGLEIPVTLADLTGVFDLADGGRVALVDGQYLQVSIALPGEVQKAFTYMCLAGCPEFADGTGAPDDVQSPGVQVLTLVAGGLSFVTGTADGIVTVWTVATAQERYGDLIVDKNELGLVTLVDPLDLSAEGAITSIAAHPELPLVVVGTSAGSLIIVDTEEGITVGEPVRIASDPITSVGFANGGSHIVSATPNGTVAMWDRQFTGTTVTQLPDLPAGTIHVRDDGLLTVTNNGEIAVRDNTGTVTASVPYPHVLRTLISPTQQNMVAVTLNQTCFAFPPFPCPSDVRLLTIPDLDEIATARLATNGTTAALAYSPSGNTLALGSADGIVMIIDPTTGAVVDRTGDFDTQLHVTSVTYLSEQVLVSSHANGSLTLWQLEDQGLTQIWQRDDLDAASVARLDDDTVIVGTRSGSISIRSIDHPAEPLQTLLGHNEPILRLYFDATSRRLASSDRASVKLWDLDTGTALLTIDDATNAELDVGGRLLHTSTPLSASGTVQPPAIRQVDLETAKRQACELVGRNLTETEWETHLPTGEDYQTTCPPAP